MILLTLFACRYELDQSVPSIEEFMFLNEEIEPFALVDQNETSIYYGQSVSTDQFPELISAWYFGHST